MFDRFLKRDLLANALNALRSYTRLSTEGLENIPRTGPVLVIPNHSGVWGWDGMILQNELLKQAHRVPRTMLHNFWFSNPHLSRLAEQLAFIPQDFKKAVNILRRNNLLLLFPEAEAGNFKSSKKMYQVQPFNPGFVALAMLTKAQIVPCCVIGAEETHLNLGNLGWLQKLFGVNIPLPLNVIPFPVKWELVFMKPIHLCQKYNRKDLKRETFSDEIAEHIRMQIQECIEHKLSTRKMFHFL